MSWFTPSDVLRLVCVLRAVSGYFAICDELDPTLAARMQALYDLLGDFVDYSTKRGERVKRRQAALKIAPRPNNQ